MVGVTGLQRGVVVALNVADMAADTILHRPAVVRASRWSPVWWNCTLARLSFALDHRWRTGYWEDGGAPGPPCRACDRRASHHEITGPDGETVPLCGWCGVSGQVFTQADLQRALDQAAADSVAWRWRA